MIIIAIVVAVASFCFLKKFLFVKKNKAMILSTLALYYGEFKSMCNSFVCHTDETAFLKKWKSTYDNFSLLSLFKRSELQKEVSAFLECYRNIHAIIELKNKAFVANEKIRCVSLLSNIDGKALDDQQQTVVVSDEDNTLVLAGAGSGKTLTIAGKVKYLCDERGVKPEDILLLSFTNKATEELTERIKTKLNINIQAKTFHKLGMDILTSAGVGYCDVYNNEKLRKFIRDYFDDEFANNYELVRALIIYFAYYFNIPNDIEKYNSLGELYEHEKGRDFETLKGKCQKQKDDYLTEITAGKRQNKETLQGEKVKSLEEVTIANFLFLNGIRYEYERPYPFDSDDSYRKKYTPDFYLPDYDLYLEHFGINREGRLPWLSDIEEKKYLEGMRWKRWIHRKNKTRLLETYSYYVAEGRLLEELERLLKKNGVEFKSVDFRDIFERIYAKKSDKYFSEFLKLCATFVTLFKSNNYSIEDLYDCSYKSSKKESCFFIKRAELFKAIISPIIEAYEKHLIETENLDFSDMINKAAKKVNEGFSVHPYEYIIIDEFQDMSIARYNLVKAIKRQTGAKTVCVGDDWQSIFRFAGSDISLFTNFKEYFGYTRVEKLETTYRNAQELINAASRFITKNPAQLPKSLHSSKTLTQPLEFWLFDGNPFDAVEEITERIIAEFGPEKSILFLGRTKHDGKLLEQSELFFTHNERMVYKNSPQTPVRYMSVHQAKGLEADNVVLLNFKNSTLGFPNKIEDDPILEFVLSDADTYEYAEERRLLYVALTRTKNRCCVLVDARSPSEFLKEFVPSASVCFIKKLLDDSLVAKVDCPRCKTGYLKVKHNEEQNRYFVGCSNYPKCDYTINETSVLQTNRRCPVCGGFLIKKSGKYGPFWGCSNFRKNAEISCGYTEKIQED